MVKTGILKYDKMPNKIGITDVDTIRSAFLIERNKTGIHKKRMLECRDKLEKIYKKWKQNGGEDE